MPPIKKIKPAEKRIRSPNAMYASKISPRGIKDTRLFELSWPRFVGRQKPLHASSKSLFGVAVRKDAKTGRTSMVFEDRRKGKVHSYRKKLKK